MKNRIIIFIGIILSLFIFIPNVRAMSIEEVKEKLESNSIVYNINNNSRYWEIENKVIDLVNNVSKECTFYPESLTYNYNSVSFKIGKWNIETEETDEIEVNVPLKLYGIVSLEDDIIETHVGQTYTVNAKKLDENFKESKITISEINFSSYDSAEINGNKIKFLKPGIYTAYVYFDNDYSKNLILLFLVDADSLIKNGLNNLTTFNSKRNTMYNDRDLISVAQSNLVSYILYNNDAFISDREIVSRSNYKDEENNIVNFDFDYVIRDKKITIKKDNVKVNEYGIVLEEIFNGSVKDLNVGDKFTPKYTAYSSAEWTSSDTSVASINKTTGEITANGAGVSVIKATFNNEYVYFMVRVKPDIEEFKSNLTKKLNELVGPNKTVYIPAVSTIGEYLQDYIWNYFYNTINEKFNDQNIMINIELSEDYKSANVNLGYSYTGLKLEENSYFQTVDYCNYMDDYKPAFDCGTDKVTIKFTYEDDKKDFDKTLITKAQELGKKVEDKLYPSYLNTSFEELLNLSEESGEVYFDKLIENANLQDIIKNNDGFKLVIDVRAGDASFGDASAFGFCYIEKDGVIYDLASTACGVKQVIRVNVAKNSTDNVVINAITDTLKSSIKNKNVDLKVTKDEEQSEVYEDDVYNINIRSVTASNVSKSRVTNVIGSGLSDGINIKTYVEKEEEPIIKEETKITQAPKISITKGNNNSLVVSWSKDDNAKEYVIYRSTSKNKGYKAIKTISENTYTDTGLKYGTTYYYKVVSKNTISKSGYSNIVNKKVVPNTVENLKINSVGTNNIKVSWDKVNAKGYVLERSTNGKKWTTVKKITKNSTLSFNNTKLKANTTYYYRVKAMYGSAHGAYSNVVKIKTSPSIPKISVKSSNYNTVNLTIKKSSGSTKYEVYRSTSKKGSYEKVGEQSSYGTFNDTNLLTGKTYYYKVKACNSNNNCSTYSNIVYKKLALNKPSIKVSSKQKQLVNIKVPLVKGADGYQILRSTKSNKGFKEVTNIDTATDYYDEFELTSTKTYYYKVRAYILVNNKPVYSAYSKVVKVKVK